MFPGRTGSSTATQITPTRQPDAEAGDAAATESREAAEGDAAGGGHHPGHRRTLLRMRLHPLIGSGADGDDQSPAEAAGAAERPSFGRPGKTTGRSGDDGDSTARPTWLRRDTGDAGSPAPASARSWSRNDPVRPPRARPDSGRTKHQCRRRRPRGPAGRRGGSESCDHQRAWGRRGGCLCNGSQATRAIRRRRSTACSERAVNPAVEAK